MSAIEKKIGIVACTGVVAGNMMGSGIALLPATLASVGSISLISWFICLIGAMSLAYVFARLAVKNPQSGGPIAYAGEVAPILGYQTAVLYYHANWIGNLAIAITGISYLSVFFPILNDPIPAGVATIAVVWIFTFVNLLGGGWVSRLTTIGLILILIPVVGVAVLGFTHFNIEVYQANWNVSGESNSKAILAAVLICLWSFVGVESASVSSGMVENPKRTVPIATMLGTAVAGLVYILSTQMISGMFPAKEMAESGAPFAMATTEVFGSWTAPFVSAFTALACFTSLGSWMMLVGEAGKRASEDGNFPKIYSETDKDGVAKKGLFLASIKMTALMVLLTVFSSGSAHAADLFNSLVTIAVLLTMLPYFYSSISLIRLEGMTTNSVFAMICSVLACIFCFVALEGAEGSALAGTFIVTLIVMMFYSKKLGYMEYHQNNK
ncbi:MAG: cadaverine/lysine antiporter [Shewanella sp.]